MSPPTSSGPSLVRPPPAKNPIDVRRVPSAEGARRGESALANRNEPGPPARFSCVAACSADTAPGPGRYSCYRFLTQLRSTRHVVPLIDQASVTVSGPGSGLGQHPKHDHLLGRRPTGPAGAFTRSHSPGHSAVELGQLDGRAYFELGTVDGRQERSDETGRPAGRSGYPLCERHRKGRRPD